MKVFAVALAASLAAVTLAHSGEGDAPDRQKRWKELAQSEYGDKTLEPTETAIVLDAPARADDAALVPMAIKVDPNAGVTGADLIIDDNPGPVAARIKFGSAIDPRLMQLRVRINGYTNVHAVAVTKDGGLLQNAKFVKASGGCSAPVGETVEEARHNMGRMRMKFGSNAEFGGAPEATLMIRHPNFNGMQQDPLTMAYTPARFIESIEVTRGDEKVFSLGSDISLTTDPVIGFLYKPGGDKPFRVTVKDTEGETWTQEFQPTQATN